MKAGISIAISSSSMAAEEFETIDEGGFVFKIRKSRLKEIAAAPESQLALQGEEAHEEDSEPVAEDQSFEEEKKRKRLLTLKAIYEAELEAWEKLDAATTQPVLDKPSSNSGPSPPEHDPQEEYLRELKIEVENVEEYIKLLQDHIDLAESTYKMCVRELREDANFRPADEVVLSLTGQASSDVDVAGTQTPSYVRSGSSVSPNGLETLD